MAICFLLCSFGDHTIEKKLRSEMTKNAITSLVLNQFKQYWCQFVSLLNLYQMKQLWVILRHFDFHYI